MFVTDHYIHQWKHISWLTLFSFSFISSCIFTAPDFCIFLKEIRTSQVLIFALERKSVDSFRAPFHLHSPCKCQKKLYVSYIREDFWKCLWKWKLMLLSAIPTSSASPMLGFSKPKLCKNTVQWRQFRMLLFNCLEKSYLLKITHTCLKHAGPR